MPEVIVRADTASQLASKQEKKVSLSMLGVWWGKTSLRTPVLIQSASENSNTSPVCGRGFCRAGRSGCWFVECRKREDLKTREFASLTNVKAKILQPCEMTAKWCFLSGGYGRFECEECIRQALMCWCMCQPQAWFSPLCLGRCF